MKTIYIKDLTASQLFTNEAFAIYEFKKAEDKNGKTYYDLKIGDKTGRIPAKIWSDRLQSVDASAIKNGKVVSVSGKVDEYKGAKQLNIYTLESVNEDSLDDFIESSVFGADEMYEELNDRVRNLKNKRVREMLTSVLNDPEISRRYKYWPAANTVHHEFRSGLLQHVLEMIAVSDGLERFYPDVDFDVLIAGIILHDIGKLFELDGSDLGVPYTTEGTLHGHIYIGARIFETFAKGKLTDACYNHILHLILSHHGTYEFGSPVLPATVEAHMLTNIDKVSARARTADSAMKNIAEDQEFSSRILWLENAKIWKTKKDDLENIEEIVEETEVVIEDGTKTTTTTTVIKEKTDGSDEEADSDQISFV